MNDLLYTQQTQDQQIKKLKRLLEGWRMALLPLKSVFLWEQQWHPCAIITSTAIFYLIIWLMDLNCITSFAFVGLFINLLDFIIPVVCSYIYNPNSWTGQKEKAFEGICQSIVTNYNKCFYYFKSFYSMRETSPILYYTSSFTALSILAFIGSTVNNTLLLYLMSNIIFLYPGLQRHGLIHLALSSFKSSKSVKPE